MLLRLEEKTLYGNVRYYPINDTAEKLLSFLGQKTFTPKQLIALENIGFEIAVDLSKPKYLEDG